MLTKDRALDVCGAILKRRVHSTAEQRQAAILWGDSLLSLQCHPSPERIAEERRLRGELASVVGEVAA